MNVKTDFTASLVQETKKNLNSLFVSGFLHWKSYQTSVSARAILAPYFNVKTEKAKQIEKIYFFWRLKIHIAKLLNGYADTSD